MMVERSMSSKTHASDKPAQAQPALPQGLPPRRPIGGTSQKASQLSHAEDKLLDGQPLDRHPLLAGDHLRLLRLDPSQGRLLIRIGVLNLNSEMRKLGQRSHACGISHEVVEPLAEDLNDLIQ